MVGSSWSKIQPGCDQNSTDNQHAANALIELKVHALFIK
jgi:hypothetical protein